MDPLLQGDDNFYSDMFPLKTDGTSDKNPQKMTNPQQAELTGNSLTYLYQTSGVHIHSPFLAMHRA
jgi:hypothetical protein